MAKSKNFYIHLLAIAVLVLLFSPVISVAENTSNIFQNSCEDYNSAEDYVKNANGYCLNQANTRACFKKARAYFKNCGYEGDFKSISQEIQKKLLVMLIVSKSQDYR